jgi:predicted nucleic acid-binding protein
MLEAAVIDASYLVEFLGNPLEEKFQWILDGKLLAPNLLRYEYNNVLLNKRKSAREADQFRDAIYSLQIECRDIAGKEEEIYALAANRKLSFYDASYLWLAVKNKLPTATYDKQILQAANALGIKTIA